MAGIFWHDGTWSTEEPKLTGPMDHAFWLGSTVFDGARSIAGLAPDLDRHCARLVDSARRMGLRPTLAAEEIEALCRVAIRRMPRDAVLYVRPMFFARGAGLGTLRPDPANTAFVLAVYDSPLPSGGGFSATLAPFRRPAPDMAPTDAKASALYPNSARAVAWAAERGFDNAVVCDANGDVAEFATANLMAVHRGVVSTPAVNGSFLDGITRQRVIALLRGAGIEVRERVMRPEELETADEIFATGNYGKVQPCARYGMRALNAGPVAGEARRLYFAWAEETSRVV